jgi:myo-inositol-1(or 4)-monophosphatase
LEHFCRFATRTRAVRRDGSAALDLAYVAAGRFDGYWEPSLSPWDVAAGSLLVREAGGRLTSYKGAKSSIYDKQFVASNGKIHEQMLALLAD